MIRILKNLHNPRFWWALIVVAAGLMVFGWARTYPIELSQQEMPVLTASSPLFWIGLCLGFTGLAGFSLSSESAIAQWLSSILLIVFLSTPHFLYIAWGSDAGGLANMSAFARQMSSFNYERDLAVVSYYQWPLGIFFNQFLSELFHINVYSAAVINFLLTCTAVGSGLFLLWHRRLDNQRTSTKAVFWGVAVYFAGFFWLLNWQASPYDFALIFFIPMLALIEHNHWKERLVLLLLITTGLEAHALTGVWLSMIIVIYLAISILSNNRDSQVTASLASIVIIAQATLIIYKNNLFFRSLALNIKGYYDALLQTGASDKALAIQAESALGMQPLDGLGTLLKTISFIDLGFIWIAFLMAGALVILRKRLKIIDLSLFLAGVIYFFIGTQYAAIGTRSFQLIGLAPAFVVIDSIAQGDRTGRMVLAASMIGLLLFPAAIMRNHQNSENYVKPYDLRFTEFVNQFREEIQNSDEMILSDGIRPIDMRINGRLLSPNTIFKSRTCEENLMLVESKNLKESLRLINDGNSIASIDLFFRTYQTTVIYDNGYLSFRINGNCAQLKEFLYPQK